MSGIANINFKINPKAFYSAIVYAFLAGLDPKDFVRRGDSISFDFDRNSSREAGCLDDFLSGNARRTVPAIQIIYCKMFPAHEKLVGWLAKRLERERLVAELSPIFEEFLACESEGRDFNGIGHQYSPNVARPAYITMRTA